jgi:hypothetical protein
VICRYCTEKRSLLSARDAKRTSRFIVAWKMCADDVTSTLDLALSASGLEQHGNTSDMLFGVPRNARLFLVAYGVASRREPGGRVCRPASVSARTALSRWATCSPKRSIEDDMAIPCVGDGCLGDSVALVALVFEIARQEAQLRPVGMLLQQRVDAFGNHHFVIPRRRMRTV